jgi:tetratricopeptide (TPR) repeat protein
MNEAPDPSRTADVSSDPADALDAGLAAGFGRAEPPCSSLGVLRPVRLKEGEGKTAHIVQPKSDALRLTAPPEDLPVVPGYRVLREIARGGMGRVLAAYDLALDREVALKLLLPGAHPDRFVRESKITARLPHPGIPPVHALGTLTDGSPFLAMKLIAGQTLADEFSSADRPRLLQAFAQVCQAVGFAHSRGVIHRDLKPANVMVGAFGEVQVMDWGLAKVLASGGRQPPDPASRERKRPGAGPDPNQTTDYRAAGLSTDDRTQAGQVLGTPAYMAPEQARGEDTDARADVFALGGILCALLTGQPPFRGQNAQDVIRRAGAADLAEALVRLDGCGADAELVSLCRRCLSPDPANRPSDGQVVADRLASYQNGVQDRLQAAERERAVAVAREAEQRKRRKVQLALAAAVVVLALGGGAFAWWRSEQAQAGRERDARNAEAVAALLGQAKEALAAGDVAKAQVALDVAKKRSAEGGAEKEVQRLGRLVADLALLRELDEVDQFRWTMINNKLPGPAAVATRTREALARFGADPQAVSVDDAAARVSASVVRERIVSALDRLLLPIRLVDVASLPAQEQRRYTQMRADVAALLPKTAAVRALLRRVDADRYRDAVRDAVLAEDRAKFARLAGQQATLEQPPGFVAFLGESEAIPVERRRQLLQAAVRRRPGNLALLMTLGFTYPLNQEGGANERLRWYQAAVAAAPAMPVAHNGLGIALRDQKDQAGAEAAFRRAIALDPKYAWAHNNLAVALSDQGQVDKAITSYRKAIALDPKNAAALNSLGIALRGKGQVDAAIACYKKAIALDPKDARTHSNLGNALIDKGQVDEAIACYKKAIGLDPNYAPARSNLGNALKDKGRVDEAIACYKKAVALDPNYATARSNLGNALKTKGRLDEAITSYRKAIALDPRFASAYDGLAQALSGKRQVDEAIDCWRKAIEIDPKNFGAYSSLSVALTNRGQVDAAIACCKKALALAPNFVPAHYNLGNALSRKGQTDAAITCYQKANALEPTYAEAHCNLGVELSRNRQLDAAIARYNKAIELNPKLVSAHSLLGVALKDKGQVDEAIACYQKAIALDANFAEAHCNLAQALRIQGRFAEALAALKRGHELGSKRPGWPYPSAAWVRQAEFLAVQDKFPAFLKGDFQPKTNDERLGLARWCRIQKRYRTSAGLSADAFAADPKLGDDLQLGHRYDAVKSAALAAAGQGEDAAKLDDKEKARLRKQGLTWLRADLALRARQLEGSQRGARMAAQNALRDWQHDSDLAGIRDAAALARLPPEERGRYERLWADVAGLLKKAQERGNKETRP